MEPFPNPSGGPERKIHVKDILDDKVEKGSVLMSDKARAYLSSRGMIKVHKLCDYGHFLYHTVNNSHSLRWARDNPQLELISLNDQEIKNDFSE